MVQWAATQSPPESAESSLESRARLAGSRAGRAPANAQHCATSQLPHWPSPTAETYLLTCSAPAVPRPPQLIFSWCPSPLHSLCTGPAPHTAPVSSVTLPPHLPLTCAAAARPALRRHLAQLVGKVAQQRARTGLILLHSSLVTHV